jgi:hypothetical protein
MTTDTAPADELHRLALARIDKLMSAEAGTPEGDELSVLADAVEAYEQKRWPMADTAPAADDLVTEEVVEVAAAALMRSHQPQWYWEEVPESERDLWRGKAQMLKPVLAAVARTFVAADEAMTAPTPAQTQQSHDADGLVTEEMVRIAARTITEGDGWPHSNLAARVLAAVAPMIAARAAEHFDCSWVTGHAVAAEREAIAQALLRQALTYGARAEAASGHDPLQAMACQSVYDALKEEAAAIRARGET